MGALVFFSKTYARLRLNKFPNHFVEPHVLFTLSIFFMYISAQGKCTYLVYVSNFYCPQPLAAMFNEVF